MKTFIQKIFTATVSILACVTAFGGCSFAAGFLGQKGSEEETYMAVRAILPTGDGRVSLANEEMTEFANGYTPCYASNFNTGKDHFKMSGLTLKWEADNAPNTYTVALSENEELSDAMIYRTESTELHIDDLFVNTRYFWQVTAYYAGGMVAQSKINRFITAATPRTIDIDGVSNTRDLGGKKLENGKQFRQGMVYRGGKLDDITEKGKLSAKEIYGIKTDLDLRNMAEGTAGGVSPLGEDIRYVHVNESPYYLGGSVGINVEKNKAIIAQSVRIFADESNYPIYVHCSLGRDRTAAVCMLIEGLLGMSKTDMEMDYETSFFSQMGSLDGQTVEHMYNMFKQMYNYIAALTREDFAKDCEAYLLEAGITEEEIASIRSILTK